MQRAHDILTGTAGKLLPTTGFYFEAKGALTPLEFMTAGDAIIANDQRWEWVLDYTGAAMDCLPADKQFLRAYDIPCLGLPKFVTRELGDWTLCDADEQIPSPSDVAVQFGDSDDPKTCMENLYDNGVSSRTQHRYDVSITYDRYYETPRIWLIGFNAFGLALSHHEMLQDVPCEYAGKTITIGRHPYTGELNMTVHPCYQMEAMHRQNHDKSSFRAENAITFALEIWASVLPRFCLKSEIALQNAH
ncbi:Autophagy-related protein 3 [Babesia sp. Xinjiang]|uniref:Autophagy-related protein 3 n=1 Tax=Babesia sp. Xinjiang TaxID=462227 RepID=UPI000A2663C6|nr:Autophagy-related protein 3 [Babesia sp. Xinjiang]ORM40569.1 Autophagy-related protein 3 [Babesia sp. Xinjiang]